MSRPWIKSYTTMLDDIRILKLNERQQLRYYQLYLLAGRLNADGLFIENGNRLDDADIAIKLRINDVKQFASDMKVLKNAKLIHVNGKGPCVEAFAREQVDWSKKQEQERERQEKHRHGTVTRDKEVTDKPSRTRHKSVTPLDQTKKEKKIKKKKEIKNPPPTKPSSSKRGDAIRAGGGGQKEITAKESKRMQIVSDILTASDLRKPRLNKLVSMLVTRESVSDEKLPTYIIGAIASAYEDTNAKNKTICAAHRLETDQVPEEFFNPDKWSKVPEKILRAAGIITSKNNRVTYQDGRMVQA